MRPPGIAALCITTAVAGFVAGGAAWRPAVPDTTSDEPRGPPRVQAREHADPRADEGDRDARERDRARAQAEVSGLPDTRDPNREAADDPLPPPEGPPPTRGEPADPSRADDGVAARMRELEGEAESCVELLGKPIARREDPPSRFTGPALSAAVGSAIEQAGVPADVEGVDCSEFPCIVFGRLAGDEEDVEEIERSAALDPYEGDVLTLLLWATTVDEAERTHPTAKETGLFALAYYDFADRAELGEELDRRIRARVLEVWNAERPGPRDGPVP